jgi:hypothetical protein
MLSLPRIAPVALFLCSFVLPVLAQTEPAKPAVSKTAATTDAEQVKLRRAQARSLLISLSTDARMFHDQTLRARSLARIADALWQVDTEQGRLMFRKAWEAAEVADQESDRKIQQDIEQQKSRTGGFAISLPPNLRREVLRLAARHDRALSEEFLEKLKSQKAEVAPGVPRQLGRLNEALSQRLSVAKELMQNGEMERALEFAGPALAVVGIDSINFLSDLREKDAAAADERYAALLNTSAANPQSDPNTVSLLSSYIFTPHLFMTFSGGGVNTSQMAQKIVPADVSPALRNAFFQSAASILLRPLPGQDQNSPSGQANVQANVQAKYLVLKRLLPFFEQGAPSEMVESLRAQLNALTELIPEEGRREDESINAGLRSEKPPAEREQSLLDRIERAKTADERDGLYIELAQMMVGRGDMKARDYIGKVEDSETRKDALAYIDGSLAIFAVKKKKTDQALELVQKGELTHPQKAWVLTQVAKVLAPTDKQRATDLIEEAAGEARRIEPSDPARPQALIAVASALKEIDPARAWDAAFEAVRAANSAEGFTGEDAKMILKFQGKSQSSIHTNDVPEFDLEGIFRDLANQDYERAVELARGFEGEGPRAVATIAIARAVLQPQKQSAAKN